MASRRGTDHKRRKAERNLLKKSGGFGRRKKKKEWREGRPGNQPSMNNMMVLGRQRVHGNKGGMMGKDGTFCNDGLFRWTKEKLNTQIPATSW